MVKGECQMMMMMVPIISDFIIIITWGGHALVSLPETACTFRLKFFSRQMAPQFLATLLVHIKVMIDEKYCQSGYIFGSFKGTNEAAIIFGDQCY